MKTEEGWRMYTEIKQLRKIGLKKSQIARKLAISRPTVYKYLEMTSNEFEDFLKGQKERNKKPNEHKNEVLSWLKEFPDMSAAQIFDRLEEKYKTLSYTESTLRRYVRLLRNEYNIPKSLNPREYEAITEFPMGKQMQVDFGEIKVKSSDGKEMKLGVMGTFRLTRKKIDSLRSKKDE